MLRLGGRVGDKAVDFLQSEAVRRAETLDALVRRTWTVLVAFCTASDNISKFPCHNQASSWSGVRWCYYNMGKKWL